MRVDGKGRSQANISNQLFSYISLARFLDLFSLCGGAQYDAITKYEFKHNNSN